MSDKDATANMCIRPRLRDKNPQVESEESSRKEKISKLTLNPREFHKSRRSTEVRVQ